MTNTIKKLKIASRDSKRLKTQQARAKAKGIQNAGRSVKPRKSSKISKGMGIVGLAGYAGLAFVGNAKDKLTKQQKETDKSIAMSNKLHNQWLKVKNAEKRKKRG